jgi:aldose 1-epimerase
MTVMPSGQQVGISHGRQHATVVEAGGGLRTYDIGQRPVLDGYAAHEMVTAARGQPLVPWPNRLHGGAYTWDGQAHQVPLDEPEKGNALHGLTRYRNWVATDQSASAVTMKLRLHPSPAYPFTLDLAVRYALGDEGLLVETTATNVGPTAAPYAQGAHPYLTVGGLVDDAVLTIPAQTWLPTDENQIPTGREAVKGTAYDFREPRKIGELPIDYAFTDLLRGPDGLARVRLESAQSPDQAVEVWLDEGYPYLEIFTGDTVPDVDRRRHGLGVEPMTAPPNAFVTAQDLIRLEPHETVTRRWGIQAG